MDKSVRSLTPRVHVAATARASSTCTTKTSGGLRTRCTRDNPSRLGGSSLANLVTISECAPARMNRINYSSSIPRLSPTTKARKAPSKNTPVSTFKCSNILPPTSSQEQTGVLLSALKRHLSTIPQNTSARTQTAPPSSTDFDPSASHPHSRQDRPLKNLPLSSILRTYLITTLSSTPLLLNPITSTLRHIIHSTSPFLSIDKNPVLRLLLQKTFYQQFCCGDNEFEVKTTLQRLRSLGFGGVILEYAPEVIEDSSPSSSSQNEKEIQIWKEGMLKTIQMVEKGDFVGLKWSGMGNAAYDCLKNGKDPSKEMEDAMSRVCDEAMQKGVKLLPAAEPQNMNAAVDAWTLKMAEKYNRLNRPATSDSAFRRDRNAIDNEQDAKDGPTTAAGVVVYNTYQCYLKHTPSVLSSHLQYAKEKVFSLGVKLVRGAYLETEQRDLIWSSKEETDAAYDSVAKDLLEGRYPTLALSSSPSHANSSENCVTTNRREKKSLEEEEEIVENETTTKPSKNKTAKHPQTSTSSSSTTTTTPPSNPPQPPIFPTIEIMLATHNITSVTKARMLRNTQSPELRQKTPLNYAQLYGMADEVSCELLSHSHSESQGVKDGEINPGLARGRVMGEKRGGSKVTAASAQNEETSIPRERSPQQDEHSKTSPTNPTHQEKAQEEEQETPKVYKCVTWGPLRSCLHYLLRRAAENRDALGRTFNTRRAVRREIWWRSKGFFSFKGERGG